MMLQALHLKACGKVALVKMSWVLLKMRSTLVSRKHIFVGFVLAVHAKEFPAKGREKHQISTCAMLLLLVDVVSRHVKLI